MIKQDKKLENKGTIIGRLTITKLKNGEVVSVQRETNKVVSSSGHGRNLVMRQLVADTTYGIAITKAKIGDDNTAPVDGDTDLGNTVLDNILIANSSATNDTANFEFFIPDGDLADGDYEEFGMFIGSQLFCRAVFSSTYSKSTGEDTLIDYDLEFTG